CGKKIGPDPRNFNQRVSLGRNDLLIRTFPNQGWFVEYGAVAAPLPVCHPFMPASLSFLLPEDIHIRSAKKKPTFRYGSELLFSRKGFLWAHNT
ncbi:hypothetical protein M2T00_27440, partial [Klebsiella pneumoniae]|nr:hypothetical protein [Klebsiella pneumoniae]